MSGPHGGTFSLEAQASCTCALIIEDLCDGISFIRWGPVYIYVMHEQHPGVIPLYTGGHWPREADTCQSLAVRLTQLGLELCPAPPVLLVLLVVCPCDLKVGLPGPFILSGPAVISALMLPSLPHQGL